MKHYGLAIALVVAMSLWAGSSAAFAATLEWKKLLLLAGYDDCQYCSAMKNEACESVSPPVKSLIEHYYVPWYWDTHGDKNTRYEWKIYSPNLNGVPFFCVIDPNDSDGALADGHGKQSP
jgi:hypothetical protein